jgi:hypothetical protein
MIFGLQPTKQQGVAILPKVAPTIVSSIVSFLLLRSLPSVTL